MAADRSALFAIPAAAALLLWPALWNGYPIVFADTGTYLSQAIDRYAGWDRPVFYSLFMLPLHATLSVWPVVAVQALLTAWILSLVCRVLVPGLAPLMFVGGIGVLSIGTWLPWIASELMPDVFTPLLILVLCLLAWVPERLSSREQVVLVGLAALMIASQQSSLPLAGALLAVLIVLRGHSARSVIPGRPSRWGWHQDNGRLQQAVGPGTAVAFSCSQAAGRSIASRDGNDGPRLAEHGGTRSGGALRLVQSPRRWLLIILPPALAVTGLCAVNLAAHGRFAISPFGNVFLLARVIYDGPGMAVLRRDCPTEHWRLCPFLDSFPPTSDDFLWTPESPMNRAGGPKAVSRDAAAIIKAALLADPLGEGRAALINTWAQMTSFASGDGLNPWPIQVSPVIEHDFPVRERLAYAAARQQTLSFSMPPLLAKIHMIAAVGGVIACVLLLPGALRQQGASGQRAACAGFLLAVLLVVPISAAITGGLSAPHDRYQARIMWLPAFVAAVSFFSLRGIPVRRI